MDENKNTTNEDLCSMGVLPISIGFPFSEKERTNLARSEFCTYFVLTKENSRR